MLKMVKAFLLGVCLLPLAAMADDTFVAGKDYQVLSEPLHTPDPKKIEVLEFFSYACPHCNDFEPVLEPWVAQLPADVEVQHVPVVFHPSWEVVARAFYAANEMGVEQKIRAPLYAAIHQDHRNVFSKDAITAFMKEQGVDANQFANIYSSFATDMRLKKGDSLLRGYEVEGTPSLAIAGKYVVSPMGGEDAFGRMIKVANFLIEKERKAMQQ